MSDPNQTPKVREQSIFFGNLLNKKIGLTAAIGISCAALFGLPRVAEADDGGYPWPNAPCKFGDAGGAKCINPTNPSDKYNWGIYDANGVFQPYRNGYEYRNCTDYVQWKESTYGLTVPNDWGNADVWDTAASDDGFAVTTNMPESGDIAQWDWMHVAFVESVNEDGSVNVSEYNYTYPGSFDRRGEAYDGTKVVADHYIDLNGLGVGLGGSQTEISTDVIDRPLGVASHPSGEQDVFWRDSGGSLREAWWANNRWNGPIFVNGGMGPLGSAPTAIVRPDNDHQNVYWKGKDNNIWQAYYDGTWNGPFPINVGGNVASQPAATAWGSEVDIFYKGANGDLMEIWQPAASTPWHGPVDLGMGPLGSAPTAMAHPNGEQDVFWRGMDGQLWEAYYFPWENVWHGPLHLAMGQIGTAPTAVYVPGKDEQDVFWMGMDSNIWQSVWSGGNWSNPMYVGMGTLGSAPTAAAWGGETDIYWRGMSPNTNFWEAWGQTFSWNGPASPGIGPIPTTYP